MVGIPGLNHTSFTLNAVIRPEGVKPIKLALALLLLLTWAISSTT
jgi:hypothetical protein